jgi:SrtB family sortase
MVEWVSSDPSVVLIDEFGLATALKNGKATITAKSAEGGFTVTSEVTVKKSSKPTPDKPETPSIKLPTIPEPKLDGNSYLTSDNLEDFHKINSEVVSWLYIPGTNINFPVAQGADNEYYLSKSLDKKKKDTGSAFIDSRSRIKGNGIIIDQNTPIYGHARGTDIFDQLENVTRSDAWFNKKSNRYVYLNTLKEETIWEIFATYYVNSDKDYYLQMEFYLSDSEVSKKLAALDPKKLNELSDPAKLEEFMCDEQEFLDFATNWKDRVDTTYQEKIDGKYVNFGYLKDRNFGVTISGKDKILTLSTCADAGTTMKYVLQAKLVKTRKK